MEQLHVFSAHLCFWELCYCSLCCIHGCLVLVYIMDITVYFYSLWFLQCSTLHANAVYVTAVMSICLPVTLMHCVEWLNRLRLLSASATLCFKGFELSKIKGSFLVTLPHSRNFTIFPLHCHTNDIECLTSFTALSSHCYKWRWLISLFRRQSLARVTENQP